MAIPCSPFMACSAEVTPFADGGAGRLIKLPERVAEIRAAQTGNRIELW